MGKKKINQKKIKVVKIKKVEFLFLNLKYYNFLRIILN